MWSVLWSVDAFKQAANNAHHGYYLSNGWFGTSVYLFGSRLDDQARGGDVDLIIESDKPLPLIRRAQIKMQLESLLGLPVDIVSKVKGVAATSFRAIAQINAVKLSGQV